MNLAGIQWARQIRFLRPANRLNGQAIYTPHGTFLKRKDFPSQNPNTTIDHAIPAQSDHDGCCC